MSTPLVIAAHGTRIPEGQADARALTARVQSLLPDVDVSVAFVELDSPTIAEAVDAALASSPATTAVVVPLMVGTGGHVRDDIPEGIEEGSRPHSGARVRYAAHLGPDPRLREVLHRRIAEARGEWEASETAVVFLGRGCSVTDANADHVRLSRVLWEEGGYQLVEPAFIQVVEPSLTHGLDRAYALGGRRLVVSMNYLFAGRLQHWAQRQAATWTEAHPDAEVRLTEVIGPCDELASVVVDRYRESLTTIDEPTPVYLAGLRLSGRRVVLVGGGTVASRRVPALLASGARVHVVAPEASELVMAWAEKGDLTWDARPYAPGDLAGAAYALACTDDPAVNAQVVAEADAAGLFCVRADDATLGTAYTPATGHVDGLTVGVVGDRNPRRSAAARDAAVRAVGTL